MCDCRGISCAIFLPFLKNLWKQTVLVGCEGVRYMTLDVVIG
jgi:hypothetical protein